MAENNEKVNWQELAAGAFWRKGTKENPSLSGYVKINDKEYSLVVFKNSYKAEQAVGAPDYKVYFAPPRQDEKKSAPTQTAKASAPARTQQGRPVAKKSPPPPPANEIPDPSQESPEDEPTL